MARRVQSCLDANGGNFQHVLWCHHISHKTNVLLFKSRCNILIGFRIIKEMPGLVSSGTLCIWVIWNSILISLQVNPTRCTILLSIFISLLYMFRANHVPIIRRNYCIYVTLVFVTLCGWRLVSRMTNTGVT
jgi:hypothetical protein